MANENPEGLEGQAKESSSETMDELFSGSLESPEGDENAGSESPQADAQSDGSTDADATGASAGESEDSELEGIFSDLEKDIPEALRKNAGNVKKKLQGYFTKKNQTISTELETLRKNQISDDLKRDYMTLYGWYEKIQKNPQEGLRELASQMGVSVEALVKASQAPSVPQEEELTPDKLVTVEDYAKFARQEARKAAEEIREKEVKPLKEILAKFQGTAEQRENIQRGVETVKEAAETLPGFVVEVDGKKSISKEGMAAIQAVTNGEFTGPNALKNAFKALTAENYYNKVKQAEGKLLEFKKNAAGASNPPGNTKPNTTQAPSSPDKFWDDLKSEPLT